MSEIGKYIYGIIPNVVNPRSVSSGSRRETEAFTTFGINSNSKNKISNGVHTIPYQDISAVVSDSEVIDYTHMLKDAVAKYLLRHQQVIEELMPEHSIIPMRVGTYACDETEVRDVLNKGYKVIKDIFGKISDKIEIDVACTWSDFNSILKDVGEEKEIKEFKEGLLANLKDVTIDDQMKVGVMVKKAVDEKREKYAFQMQNVLKNVSQDYKRHELMDDKMVINCAFLIEKVKREDFDRKIEELNTEFRDELNFRCVGPLPPYSFYTLEIKKMDFKEIDWARKRLGLNDIANKDEIKKAHQRLAFSLHPDKNPDTPDIEREFDNATRAYKILLDYAQAFEQTAQFDKCSFKEEEFKKNAILVKVRQ